MWKLAVTLLFAASLVAPVQSRPKKGHAAHVTYHALTLHMARRHGLRPTRYMGTVRGYEPGDRVAVCGLETRICVRVLVVDVWRGTDGMERHVDYDLNVAAHNAICPFTTKEPYWKCHARTE